jgi:hypothetical protein
VIVCGGGPAALGPLIAAARSGTLEEVLSTGVLVIERDDLGGGSLAHYPTTSNSVGGAFLRCFDGLGGRSFPGFADHRDVRELRRFAEGHPPLPLVARSLKVLGDAMADVLSDHPRCGVALGASVREIRCLPGGGVEVLAARGSPGRGRLLAASARRTIIAMGGEPMMPAGGMGRLLAASQRSGSAACHADDLIDSRRGVPGDVFQAAYAAGHVAIIGGSHSAWTAAGILGNDPRFRCASGDPPRISLMHRHPVRLYYRSAERARADGYAFDADRDRCPLTGRINRFGGLRGDAHALARAVLRGARKPGAAAIRLIPFGGTADMSTVAGVLASSGAIVAATGHQAALPRIYAADGRPVVPAVSRYGTATTSAAELVDVDGNPYPDILVYGLGAGSAVNTVIGGEPGYHRRVLGVWIFQSRLGESIARTICCP